MPAMNPVVRSRKILRDGTLAWRNKFELPSKEWLHVPQIAATEIGRRLGTPWYAASEADGRPTPSNISARTQEEDLLNLIPSPPRPEERQQRKIWTPAEDMRAYSGTARRRTRAAPEAPCPCCSREHHHGPGDAAHRRRRHSVRRRDAKLHKGKTYH
jgi:hypothetical protein